MNQALRFQAFPSIAFLHRETERVSWHSALSLHSNLIPVAILPTLSVKNQENKKKKLKNAVYFCLPSGV